MTFAGHTRQYYVTVPPSPPTGLIIALSPSDIVYTSQFCTREIGQVAAQTGAMVVCPAARVFNSSGPGHPGGMAACWESFPHYGYCMGGAPESDEDMDFLVALIERIKSQYTIPDGRTIMSGISNGGSASYRFNCEHADMIDGLVIGIQAWFDPYAGYFDYMHERLPPVRPPQCHPQRLVPLYSADGTKDSFYGQPPRVPGFESVANWEVYSTTVLGCTGNRTVTSRGPHDFWEGTGTVCYTYPHCPAIVGAGLNIMCEVTNMTHDGTALGVLLPSAFADFFTPTDRHGTDAATPSDRPTADSVSPTVVEEQRE